MSRKLKGGRYVALEALSRWEQEGLTAEAALEATGRGIEPRERGLAQELTLGVLRWRSRLDDLLKRLLSQPPGRLHPAVLNILRLGLYQLRSVTRIPARAVVHESVELCRLAGVPWATGLVNGVLRRYDRERTELEADDVGSGLEGLARRYAHPLWLVRQLHAVAGEDLESWLEANNSVPPLTLRVNTARTTRKALIERLRDAGHDVHETVFSPDGIVLESGGLVTALPGFTEGAFAVQDEASQLIGAIVDAQPGERILDACAAPGGKSAHLAARVGAEGHVYATDLSRDRLAQVSEAVERLVPGRVTVAQVDWSAPAGRLEQAPVPEHLDRVLVDAPCSGFGVLWRKPEIKWRRRAEDISRNPARQRAILEAVAKRVRPGGTLVYSVCTPLPAEGPAVVEGFLAAHPEFRRVDLHHVFEPAWHSLVTAEGDFRSFPHRHRCDAFYAARLERAI